MKQNKTNKKRVVDLALYVFDYEAVFRVAEMRQQFHEHLKKELNTEPLEFLDQIEKYKTSPSEANAKQIYETFIDSQGKKYVNLCAAVTAPLAKLFAGKTVAVDASTFDAAYDAIKLDLGVDVFPRFCRNPKWLSFVEQHGKSFFAKVSKPRVVFDYARLTPELYECKYLTDTDIQFGQFLLQDSPEWTLSKWMKLGNISVYKMKKNILSHIPISKNAGFYKYYYDLDFPYEYVSKMFHSIAGHKLYDPQLNEMVVLEHNSKQEMNDKYPGSTKDSRVSGNTVWLAPFNPPFMFKTIYPRVLLNTVVVKHDPIRRSLTMFGRPSSHESLPKTSKKTFLCGICCDEVVAVGPNKCRVVQVIGCDLKGLLQKISPLIMLERITAFRDTLHEILKNKKAEIDAINSSNDAWWYHCEEVMKLTNGETMTSSKPPLSKATSSSTTKQ